MTVSNITQISEQSHLTLNERHKNRRWTRVAYTNLLWMFRNSRKKSFYNFGNIIMNDEFSLGISQRRRIRRFAYICICINITSTKMRFRLKLIEEAVIFKFLKYTVPTHARSFVHTGDSLVPIVHTGSIFLSKKEKCPQRSFVPNAELLISVSSDSLG